MYVFVAEISPLAAHDLSRNQLIIVRKQPYHLSILKCALPFVPPLVCAQLLPSTLCFKYLICLRSFFRSRVAALLVVGSHTLPYPVLAKKNNVQRSS